MDHLQTEARNPASTNLDELTPLQIVQLMNREDARVIEAAASQAPAIASAIERIAERLLHGGRLVYIGAGTSGRLGVLDASECPPTFSTPPEMVVGLIAGGATALTRAVEGAEDNPDQAVRDLQAIGLSARDVLVGIATSGRTPYVIGAADYARKIGTYTIGLSCTAPSDLDQHVDLPINPLVGPEILSGSTRLKAGTVTKLILNMLSTGTMVRLGKSYGNLMVDLRATNSKLRARTNRIVRILTGLSVAEATALLEQCDGELKTALVVQSACVSPEEARRRLQAANGQVRSALVRETQTSATTTTSTVCADLVLGVDGGGTNTVALLARATQARTPLILGKGQAGPSNLQSVGVPRALSGLGEAIAAAFRDAKISPTPVSAICLGLAGAARPDDRQIIIEWAEQSHIADRVEVTTDGALLLAAGTPSNVGIALVAGTGSIAVGRNERGEMSRAGGWGYLMGDEGSGYALVLGALQAVARAADGRDKPTDLTRGFLEQFKLKEPQELVPTVYRGGLDRTALAALAPIVLLAAELGDLAATGVVEHGARMLAETALAVTTRLDIDPATVPFALAGGLLLGSTSYRNRVVRCLVELGVHPDPITLVPLPAEGAIRLALQLLVSAG